MDNKDFLVELTERFTNTDSGCGTMTSRESQIMLIASEIYTEQVKNNDLLHNVTNSLTYDELKEIITKSCDIEDVRKYIDHRLG